MNIYLYKSIKFRFAQQNRSLLISSYHLQKLDEIENELSLIDEDFRNEILTVFDLDGPDPDDVPSYTPDNYISVKEFIKHLNSKKDEKEG